MKEQNGSEKKKGMTKEKKFYLFTAIGCAVTLTAIILLAVLLPNKNVVDEPTVNAPQSSVEEPTVNNPNTDEDKDNGTNEPVVNTPEGMMMPFETVSIGNDYGFYHNKTLNNYYEHKGVDFSAEVGTQVLAADDGVVESIYKHL